MIRVILTGPDQRAQNGNAHLPHAARNEGESAVPPDGWAQYGRLDVWPTGRHESRPGMNVPRAIETDLLSPQPEAR
jgi:hypothetical protein